MGHRKGAAARDGLGRRYVNILKLLSSFILENMFQTFEVFRDQLIETCLWLRLLE